MSELIADRETYWKPPLFVYFNEEGKLKLEWVNPRNKRRVTLSCLVSQSDYASMDENLQFNEGDAWGHIGELLQWLDGKREEHP